MQGCNSFIRFQTEQQPFFMISAIQKALAPLILHQSYHHLNNQAAGRLEIAGTLETLYHD